MSLSAKLLREESHENRLERCEMRHEMFIVNGNLDLALKEIFVLKGRTSSLESENKNLWRSIYALVIGYIFLLFVVLYLHYH